MRFLRRLHEGLLAYGRLLLREHTSPYRVACAIVLGAIVGCLPLFGVHIFVCIALTRLLRLNLPIMYGAANISIPPLMPFIGWGAVQLGEYFLHGQFLSLGRQDFTAAALPGLVQRFFVAWMLGGAILGTGLGIVGAGVVLAIFYRRAAKLRAQNPIVAAIARASRRYARTPRRFRYYARAKYQMDPCYKALCERISEAVQVVDLGCGLGMLGVALAELGGARQTFGVDWDEQKIAAGRLAAVDLPAVTLVQGDLRSLTLPPADVVTIIDVLHYYDAATQTAVLGRAQAALRPGGCILIRETDPLRTGGARLTRLFERAMVQLGWNRGPQVHYRPIEQLCQDLAALGFACERLDVAGATHPGNILLLATTKSAD